MFIKEEPGGCPVQREGKDSQSLRRALRLLSCFTFEKPEWGVTELAVALKEHKKVEHRILTTLLNNEFLRQDSIEQEISSWNKVFLNWGWLLLKTCS